MVPSARPHGMRDSDDANRQRLARTGASRGFQGTAARHPGHGRRQAPPRRRQLFAPQSRRPALSRRPHVPPRRLGHQSFRVRRPLSRGSAVARLHRYPRARDRRQGLGRRPRGFEGPGQSTRLEWRAGAARQRRARAIRRARGPHTIGRRVHIPARLGGAIGRRSARSRLRLRRRAVGGSEHSDERGLDRQADFREHQSAALCRRRERAGDGRRPRDRPHRHASHGREAEERRARRAGRSGRGPRASSRAASTRAGSTRTISPRWARLPSRRISNERPTMSD